jgi:hypothetical protein
MSKVNDKNVGFAEGTTVLMANGSLKPIEKIQPGEWVMSFDTNSSSSDLEPREVIDTFKHIIRDVLEVQSGEDSMIVARGQLFLAPNADWHFAHEVANITDVDGNPRTFNVTKVIGGKHKIYDIIVDRNHSLVANGFRVHNGDFGSLNGIGSSSPSPNAPGGSQSQNTPVNADRGVGRPSGLANAPGGNKVSEPKGDSWVKFGSDPNKDTPAGGGGGDNRDRGGGGGRDTPSNPQRSGRRSKSAPPKAQSAPAPDKKVLAYVAYIAVQETMDYICDVQITYLGTSYFTVRTAVSNYMKYADALSKDALAHVLNSTMGQSDKNNLQAFHEDITNVFTIIRNSWATPDDTAVNLESIKRACLNVKQFIDRSTGVIGKYIGSQAPTLKYTVPGLPIPSAVQLPTGVQSPLYVKTTANTWITTAPSASGNTTTPPTTGGIGASYTKTRVVRGYLYSYAPGKGWSKIGPADQYRELS